MRIDVVTLFSELVNSVAESGVTGKAVDKQLLSLNYWNPRDYTQDKHRTVDDRPYGGGPGMVMKYEPLHQAITEAKAANPGAQCIYMSPQGKPIQQKMLQQASEQSGLILLAGRYEGLDQRVIDQHVDEEWSLGDYVVSGGELAAMVVIDGITRLLPGALGHEESAVQDSFANELKLLDCSHYTRPEVVEESGELLKVPEVLLQGNHQAIEQWRRQQILGNTWLKRPDLLNIEKLGKSDRSLLDDFISKHNNNNKT